MKRLQSGLLCALFALQTAAHAQITLEVSVFPELDRSVKAALPLWASLHPDITINYNVVGIALSTHSEGGVTTKDFDLAGAIDQIHSALP